MRKLSFIVALSLLLPIILITGFFLPPFGLAYGDQDELCGLGETCCIGEIRGSQKIPGWTLDKDGEWVEKEKIIENVLKAVVLKKCIKKGSDAKSRCGNFVKKLHIRLGPKEKLKHIVHNKTVYNPNLYGVCYTERAERPPPPPPPPSACPSGSKCCEPMPNGGCNICIRNSQQCP